MAPGKRNKKRTNNTIQSQETTEITISKSAKRRKMQDRQKKINWKKIMMTNHSLLACNPRLIPLVCSQQLRRNKLLMLRHGLLGMMKKNLVKHRPAPSDNQWKERMTVRV